MKVPPSLPPRFSSLSLWQISAFFSGVLYQLTWIICLLFLQALIQSSLWCNFCSFWAKAFQPSHAFPAFTTGDLKQKWKHKLSSGKLKWLETLCIPGSLRNLSCCSLACTKLFFTVTCYILPYTLRLAWGGRKTRCLRRCSYLFLSTRNG